MDLQNGYKVIYDKAENGYRTFYASKSGVFADATPITEEAIKIGQYKLIYEKDGKIYGSTTGVPADNDHYFEDFAKVFILEEPKQEEDEQQAAEPTVEPVDNKIEDEDPANDGEGEIEG